MKGGRERELCAVLLNAHVFLVENGGTDWTEQTAEGVTESSLFVVLLPMFAQPLSKKRRLKAEMDVDRHRKRPDSIDHSGIVTEVLDYCVHRMREMMRDASLMLDLVDEWECEDRNETVFQLLVLLYD